LAKGGWEGFYKEISTAKLIATIEFRVGKEITKR
jgi:hypothetical protein